MRSESLATIATYALLLAAGSVSVLIPDSLPGVNAAAPEGRDTIRIMGLARDFHAWHADFGITPDAGTGHYADMVGRNLGPDGRPAFAGTGAGAAIVDEFSITSGTVVPATSYALRITVLGAAIQTGADGYHEPVTTKIRIGSQEFEPFGPFDQPVEGNVNDNESATGHQNTGANPRAFVVPTVYSAGQPITVTGRSWSKTNDSVSGLLNTHWTQHLFASAGAGSPQVQVLRNGDPCPNLQGAYDQASIEEYVSSFLDASTGTIDLNENQVIYLFELGTTTVASGDFQDLVVLIDLASDPAYFTTGNEMSTTLAQGGYRIASQWRDASGEPIPPHLSSGARGAEPVIVATIPTPPALGVMDTWDSSQGTYGAGNSGGAPNFVADPSSIPTVSVPVALAALPTQGDVTMSGTTVLSADTHYNELTLGGTLRVSGHVSILCDAGMLATTGSAIELDPGATLTAYLLTGSSNWNHVEVNRTSNDPSRVVLYNLSSDPLVVHNHAEVNATIISPDAPLHLANHGAFYGRFAGKTVTFDGHGDFHFDEKSISIRVCGTEIHDTAGARGAASTGGLSSADSFDQWFSDALGVNLSMAHPITLTWSDARGAYEYSTAAFDPIGDNLFGPDNGERNDYFTYCFQVSFTHAVCGGYYLEFEGDDDAWAFIDGRLALDLGGVLPRTAQRVDFDRLGLEDGEVYDLRFFYAHRNGTPANFRLRTNVPLNTPSALVTVNNGFD